MAKVASKQKRISDIALMLEKGFERKQILQKLSKTCKMSARTLDNEIKEAKTILADRNAHKEQVRINTTEQAIKDAVNEAILSDFELESILCKIASGNMQVAEMFNGVPTLRDITPNEVINAVKTIFAKRGSYAPTKTALTDILGNDAPQQKTILIMPFAAKDTIREHE